MGRSVTWWWNDQQSVARSMGLQREDNGYQPEGYVSVASRPLRFQLANISLSTYELPL